MIALIIGFASIVGIVFLFMRLFAPKSKGLTQKELKLYNAVQQAHDSKNYGEVISLLEGKELANTQLHIAFGNALICTGKKAKGIKVFNESMAKYFSKNETYKALGFSLSNNGHYPEAIAALQSIEKDWLANEFKYDTGYDVIEELGTAFVKIGKHDLAIETLKGAPLGKKNITDGLNKIFILLAECYEKTGDKKNCIKFLKKSLAYKYDGVVEEKLAGLESAASKQLPKPS